MKIIPDLHYFYICFFLKKIVVAKRVADEMGVKLGNEVGYSVC